MLAKIEHVYLSILRVVILVAATIALIVAAVGLVTSVPSMLRWAGITHADKPLGGSLREFIEEQKITETASAGPPSEQSQTYYILPDIQKAAALIQRYLARSGTLTEQQWRIGLQKQADGFGVDAEPYAESVLRIAQELDQSTGKRLSEARVTQLIDWNTERFRADLTAKQAEDAQRMVSFWAKLAAAGMAFVSFVAIVFIFLFVKIERNLRPPQETPVAPGDGPYDA